MKLQKPMENKSELFLSYFLLSVIKACEQKSNKLDNNSVYKYFGPNFKDYFEVKHFCMRYGKGMERPKKIFDTMLGD
jgi:regulator of sigma D